MHGRYPDYNVLDEAGHWDEVTRRLVLERVEQVPPIRFFTDDEALDARRVLRRRAGPGPRAEDPGAEHGRRQARSPASSTASATPTCPTTARPGGGVALGLDAAARQHGADDFAGASEDVQTPGRRRLRQGQAARRGVGRAAAATRPGRSSSRAILSAFYSHPWAWNEIGFGGPAYPRGYARLGVGQRESWEGAPAFEVDPVERHRAARSAGHVSRRHELRTLLRGALRPPDNDSAFLLDVHRRARARASGWRATTTRTTVDLVIVGAGAGGGTLAQRLARRGLEGRGARVRARSGIPTRTGSPTRPARTGSTGPTSGSSAALIRSSSARTTAGHGVGGSMVHYAGYCPRFHPSDFEVRTRDGVGEDWPIRYRELKRALRARSSSSCRWPASTGRGAIPHRYPHTAASDRRRRRRARARAPASSASRCASGRSAITNGAFGNRPHCIYRGYLPAGLQGQRQGLAAGHPHSRRDRARRRDPRATAWPRGSSSTSDRTRAPGSRYLHDGSERFQRADAVAVAGYSIETPRLLLNSTSRALPARPGQRQRPGRALRDGAGRAAGGRPLPG